VEGYVEQSEFLPNKLGIVPGFEYLADELEPTAMEEEDNFMIKGDKLACTETSIRYESAGFQIADGII
jgi:hypothetical protein